jgi:hypothetical protein
VVAATPRPARAATPRPGELAAATQTPRPTTLGSSVGQSVAPQPRKKSKAPVIALALAGAVAAAVGVYVATRGGEEAQVAAREPEPQVVTPPEAPVKPAEPEEIVLTLVLDPADALVTIDGAERAVVDGAVRLPRDAGEHDLTVSAEGFTARTLKIRAGGDQTMTIALKELPSVVTAGSASGSAKIKKPTKDKGKGKGSGGKGKGAGDSTSKGSPIEETL